MGLFILNSFCRDELLIKSIYDLYLNLKLWLLKNICI